MSRTNAILQRLLALHPNKLIDLKLDRIERLLAELGHPEERLPPTIHVAGTNGKGSTIAFLRAFLEAAGQRVHVYTSPDLVRFNERIRLAGKLVSSRKLNAALERCEQLNAGRPITYFEITTAAAILLFAENPGDYLLLEVGLGGRFDATNVIAHPLGTIITPVSMDHEDFLGSSLAGIAREKAGILKRGSKAIVARQRDEATAAIDAEAAKLNVEPFRGGQDFDAFLQNGRLIYQDGEGLLDLPPPALAGPFQAENAGVAIAAVRHLDLPITEDLVAAGLRRANWPARLMPITQGRLRGLLPKTHELWIDGGHNEAGGHVLAKALVAQNEVRSRPLVLIQGTFANKDAAGYLRHFKSLKPRVFTVPVPGERAAWKPVELAALAQTEGLDARATRGLKSALKRAAEIKNARVVICGSLHLAGHALDLNGTRLT